MCWFARACQRQLPHIFGIVLGMSDTKSNFIQGAVWLGIAQMMIIGTGYLIHLWVARILGPYHYGLYGVVLGVMGTVNIILTYGLSQALSKYTAAEPPSFGTLFKKSLKIQAVVALVVTLVYVSSSGLLASLLADPELTPILRFSALTLPFYAIYALNLGALNGLRQFKNQAILSTLYALVKATVAFALTKSLGLFGAISGFIAAPLAGLVIGLVYLAKQIKTSSAPTKVTDKQLLKFAFSFSLLSLFIHVLMNTDLFLVKAILEDNQSAGFYTAATTVARIPYFVIAGLAFTLLPTTSALSREQDLDKLHKLVTTAARTVLFLLTAGLALGLPESERVITILYSDTYLPAVVPFSILLSAFSILALFFISSNIVAGLGKPHLPMITALVATLISAGVGWFLIPIHGLEGAAVSTLLATSLATLTMLAYLFRRVPYPDPRMVLRFLFTGALVLYLNNLIEVSLLLLTPKLALLGLLYLALLVLLKEVKKEEFKWLRGILKLK